MFLYVAFGESKNILLCAKMLGGNEKSVKVMRFHKFTLILWTLTAKGHLFSVHYFHAHVYFPVLFTPKDLGVNTCRPKLHGYVKATIIFL